VGTTVHQALHGYSDGHRQLACSAALSPKDARLVLVMSDVSGSGVTGEGIPYITGYPLAESGLYALAKTWPATELPRPGSVWTHTIFVEFAELATLDRPSSLAKLFRRPSMEQRFGYDNALLLGNDPLCSEMLSDEELFWFGRLATGLYGLPDEPIWARRDPDFYVDEVVLRIWDQQWPRLRRSFKFCTLTTTDRSQDGFAFDLQLCPSSAATSRLRFQGRFEGWEAVTSSDEAWMRGLLADVWHPERSEIRQALRLIGTDVLGGRAAMRPICELLVSQSASIQMDVNQIVDLVNEPGLLATSKLAKMFALRTVLPRSEHLSDESLRFVAKNIDFLPSEELEEFAPPFSERLWATNPVMLASLWLDDRPSVQIPLRHAAQGIIAAELLDGLSAAPDLVHPLLTVRPDLAELPEFWGRTQCWPKVVANIGIDLTSHAVLDALVLGLHDEGAMTSALHEVGTLAVLKCIQTLDQQPQVSQNLDAWVRHACSDTDAVAKFLAQSTASSAGTIYLVSQQLQPDAVPNDFGDDPWLIALRSYSKSRRKLPVELLAYGFRRGMGWRSRSVAELLSITFEALHRAAEQDSIPETSWSMLENALPSVRSDFSWDRALRLRKAAAKRATDMRFSAEDFLGLAESEVLFGALLEEVWQLWDGSWFLKSMAKERGRGNTPTAHKCHQLLIDFVERKSHWW
jgi:hypothetical protein